MADKMVTMCPWCEEDMEIAPRDLLAAYRFAKTNKTPILVSHSGKDGCCRVSVLPSELEDMAEPELLQYVKENVTGEDDSDWLPCLRPESFALTVIPLGMKKEGGIKYYQAPSSTQPPRPDGFMRREYMAILGYDPECDMAQRGMGKAPRKLSGLL